MQLSKDKPKTHTIKLLNGPLHGMYLSADEEFCGDKLELRGRFYMLGMELPVTLYYVYSLSESGRFVEAQFYGYKHD